MPVHKMQDSQGNDIYVANCNPVDGVVETTPFDRAIGRSISARLNYEPANTAEEDLVGDTFFAMYNNEVSLIPEEDIPSDRKVNHAILKWAMEQDNFDQARAAVANKLYPALCSTSMLWSYLVTDEALKEALEKQKEAEQLREQARKKMMQAGKLAGKGDQAGADDLMAQAGDLQQQAQGLEEAAVRHIENVKENPLAQGNMAQAVEKSKDEGEKMDRAIRAWGSEQGSGVQVDQSKIEELMNNPFLRDLSEKIGRFEGVASQAINSTETQTRIGVNAEVDITRRLTSMFPSELAKMSGFAPPIIRTSAQLRYIRQGLLGWKPKQEPIRKGAFVGMIDGSGSMSGDREVLAKAIILGMAKALGVEHDNKSRAYHLATFSSSRDDIIVCNSGDNWATHLNWATKMQGGGTDFNIALRHAMKTILHMEADGVKGVDMVFITDGEASISDTVMAEWKQFAEDHGTRMFYVSIMARVNDRAKELAEFTIGFSGIKDFNDKANKTVEDIILAIAANDRKERQ